MRDLNPVDNYLHGSWEALGNGAPMLVALAQLANDTWVGSRVELPALEDLQPASKAILYAARQQGMIEIRAVNSAFEASARMLAVYVEVDEERTIAFRDPQKPSVTLQFLDGFRELCRLGLVLHHIHRDFSLSSQALDLAQTIDPTEVSEFLDMATEFGIHD